MVSPSFSQFKIVPSYSIDVWATKIPLKQNAAAMKPLLSNSEIQF